MPDRSTRSSRLAATMLVGLVSALLGLWPLFTGGKSGQWLERTSYDSLHILASDTTYSNGTNSPVILVYLDPASYRGAELDPLQPWPRSVHAQLIRHLTDAGAKAIVFDILFAGPGTDAEADRELAAAIRSSGHVVLAGEYDIKSSHETDPDAVGSQSRAWAPPFEPFANAASAWGLAVLRIDDDLVVRRHFTGLSWEAIPSLARATATAIGVNTDSEDLAEWMRYYGPALSLPHVSYAEALSTNALPSGFFRDQVVFVGARTAEGSFDQLRDEFRSPFHSWGRREFFMPGVEVHATQFLNLLRRDGLHRLDPLVEVALLVALGFLLAALLVRLRPLGATFAAVGAAALAAGGSVIAFRSGGWFPWMIVALVQVPATWVGAVVFRSFEWILARRRLEAERRIAQERIREQAALIDGAQDAILVLSPDGVVTYANPSAERLIGRSSSELSKPTAIDEVFAPSRSVVAEARSATLRDGEWNGELTWQTSAGRPSIVASRWTLLRDAAGRPKGLLLINTDITEAKALEAQFLRAQRMNTIGALAGGMAHDLNNALAPILMGVQLLRRKSADDESRRMLQMIEESTHRGADMVRQVLHFARGRDGVSEPVDLVQLVHEIERLIRDTFPPAIILETYLPKDLRAVTGQPTELHQILLNLAVNARDAMLSGGRLTVAADNVELSVEEAAAIPNGRAGRFVSLIVSDTGSGMTKDVRARIFEPFFTTKPEGAGTGIGLASVLRIVRSHDGFLRVESTLGEGSTFEVFLPIAEKRGEAHSTTPIKGTPRGNGETILVADDELALRELLADGLQAEGYRVLAAANGAVALQLLRDHGATIRLLISDRAMPEMDGSALIAEARRLRVDLPIVLLSRDETTGIPANVRQLAKPFTLDELLQTVAEALGKSNATS
jgi:two-component system, cell cycle sensor histidine kinase and response regulator CckA